MLECFRELGVDLIIAYQIYLKLDKETIIAYEQSLQNPHKLQQSNDLLKFVDQRFKTLDAIKQKTDSSNRRQYGNQGGNSTHKAHIWSKQLLIIAKYAKTVNSSTI